MATLRLSAVDGQVELYAAIFTECEVIVFSASNATCYACIRMYICVTCTVHVQYGGYGRSYVCVYMCVHVCAIIMLHVNVYV